MTYIPAMTQDLGVYALIQKTTTFRHLLRVLRFGNTMNLKSSSKCKYLTNTTPKASVSFTDYNLSVFRRRRCRRRCKLFTFLNAQPISTNLGTKYPWLMGIQVCSNERHALNYKKCIDEFKKNPLLQNQQANFNQTSHKASLGEGNSNLYK